jgi:heptosyltransferase-1
MQSTEEIKTQIKDLLLKPELLARKIVMVCPGSAWRNKQMNSAALCNLLSHFHDELNSSFIFVWGTEEEKRVVTELQSKFPEHAVVVDRLPLPGLQNLMNQVDLVIAMDSLPLHLAGTTKTPTYSIFGASLANKYKPLGEKHLAFQGNCPYGRIFEKRCPILRSCPTGACIQSRNGDELFEYYLKKTEK